MRVKTVFVILIFSSLAFVKCQRVRIGRDGRGKAPVPHNERMKVCLMSHNSSFFSDFRLAYSFCAVLYISSNTETQRLLFFIFYYILFCNLLNVHVYLTYRLDRKSARTPESFFAILYSKATPQTVPLFLVRHAKNRNKEKY